jgi:hypothetical protein
MNKDFGREARLIRKIAAGADLEKALRKAVNVLAEHQIHHLVCGGFVVQELGYPSSTKGVDIIVPDRRRARSLLLGNGFLQSDKAPMVLVDAESKVEIDLLPGGKKPTGQEVLALPMPQEISFEPRLLSLKDLITHKLSAGRSQDCADVVGLIKANGLPEKYPIDQAVADEYHSEWNVAAAEQAVEGLMGREDEDE